MTEILLIVTGMIEAGAGLALVGWPSLTITFLLGSSLEAPAALTVGRVAGGRRCSPWASSAGVLVMTDRAAP